MELLVYARNHGLDSGRTFVGIALGHAPRVEMLADDDATLTSWVEARVRADVADPATEIALLIAKALATQGLPGGFRELHFEGVRGSIKLVPEPGFDSTRSICAAIIPVVQRCRVHRTTLTTAPVASA